MKMRYLSLLILFLSLAVTGEPLPVDKDIEALRSKADRLVALKEALLKNRCTIQHLGNTVPLTAAAMRGEGLVMSMGPNIPGQYLAYYEGPKPQDLEMDIIKISRRWGAGKSAILVEVQLDSEPGSPALKMLSVRVKDPVQIDSDGWLVYSIHNYRLAMPKAGEHAEISGAGPLKSDIVVSCN
jgi:hypothetical protein